MVKFKFWLYTIAGIVLLPASMICAENETFLESAEDLVFHFPRYLEEALNLPDPSDEKLKGNQSNYLFEKSQCTRDLLRIFTGVRQKKMWAIQGMINKFKSVIYYNI